MQKEPIVLKKVRVHNLKGVDLTIQPGELVVFTGVSGSGKSSLAFDTIFAEGQRRYIESLSHHARRVLGDLPKPDAESITGIAPTIAIEQKLAGRTPRSTVGTMTGIYDYLRVLFARIATPYCPVSQTPVAAQSREKIIAALQSLPAGSKLYLLSPFARSKKAEFKEEFADLLQKGFTRLKIDGAFVDLSEIERLDGSIAHDIDLVIDRLVVSPETQARIAESATQALDQGEGVCSAFNPDTEEETLFSQHAFSKESGLSYGPLEPHDFSFNHPSGMCLTCHGLGIAQEFNLAKIIDPELSISEDCCSIGSSYQTVRFGNIYDNLAKLYKFSVKTPWKDLSEEAKKVFLYGTGQKWTRMTFIHPEKKSRWIEFVSWKGVLHEARERLNAAKSDMYRKNRAELMTECICPDCKGARIKPYPAAARLGNKTLFELTTLTLQEAADFFEQLTLPALEQKIAEELLKEIRERFGFLIRVGVSYLALERTAPTLSGGEAQRVRLASQIGSGLVGAIYVLDEPSIGLHPFDHHKLVHTLLKLRDQGNTVLVVEHDLETMLAADTIIDVGPGAGVEGGTIVAQGRIHDLVHSPNSLTGAYLSGKVQIEIPASRRSVGKECIEIKGASHHNLKNVNVSIPLGGLICVTGVSGSGKSSLITDILTPKLVNHLHNGTQSVGRHREMLGLEHLDKVIAVDQSPIGRTPRSNAATYTKLFDDIRDLFTQLPESKLRGFSLGHFSFNVKEGSCAYCSGLGSVRVDMDFLEDAFIECPQCKGKRFEPEILAVRFKGKNIHDVLSSSVESCLELFDSIPIIRRKLEMLQKVGLGYLTLGQSSTTLSGGEAQRIKLAKELVRPSTKRTLYIFDEPTTGLHFEDIKHLIAILQELVNKGSTILVIEHNMDLVKVADWVIDLGPGAGKEGGELIGAGTPEQIARKKTPTGSALKDALRPSFTFPARSYEHTTHVKEFLEIKGAEQNNLKKISLSIPRGKMTVLTGPSGSGKSSLAFDTLYAEGQRRYAETLPSYARQAIKQLPKPKVERIEGLSPALALEQKTGGLNPRSTIGTITEIYDWLRILYAHLGTAFCPETGEEIRTISKESVAMRILEGTLGEKFQILAPLPPLRKESFQELKDRLSKEGFLRIRLNGVTFALDDEIPFEAHRKNEICLVIDRLVVDPKSKERLLESLEKCAQITDGIILIAREGKDQFYNLSFAVESTGVSYPLITAQTFSFNAQEGMCLECQGLGVTYGAHLEEEKSLQRKCILDLLEKLWGEHANRAALLAAEQTLSAAHVDVYTPLKQLSKEQLSIVLNGAKETDTVTNREGLTLRWLGLHPLLERLARLGSSEVKETLLPLLRSHTCPSCQGARLNPLACNVRIRNLSLPELCRLSLKDAELFMQKLELPANKQEMLAETLSQIKKQLMFLLEIGVHYLTLERSAPTLSGGELQRIRLARQLGSGLTSCLYILDEPTIGLHPHNSTLLLSALRGLRDLGNTLVLVEHDPLIVKEADYLFDFGPKAGKEGGRITAHGTIKEIMKNPLSLTGSYLSGKNSIPIPQTRRLFAPDVRVEGATLHNLKNISVSFPKGAITCLTGVSGSGKSSLVRHLLGPAAQISLKLSKKIEPIEYLGAKFYGLHEFEQVITMDQSPIGQTSRADVSTYTDIQPLLRAQFAALPQAKMKGLQGKHFSPNHLRGMCRTCMGLGYRNVDLQFLPAVRIPCDACKGYRLNKVALDIHYKGKHFGQMFEMSVADALDFWSNIPRIARRLQTLVDVGLSYLHLGQELASLSGGEAQRLRLSNELSKRETGSTLYLIDEPTVGLHSEDIKHLILIFQKLAKKKNTLVIIEHNLDVIANADYLIDLGPEAGIEGGQVIATGTPEEVARVKQSHTGKYLAKTLNPVQ